MFSTCVELFIMENSRLCSMHRTPVGQKITESANFYDFYQFLNTYFSATISSISSIKVPIQSLAYVDDKSIAKHFFLIFPSESRQSERLKLFIFSDLSRKTNSQFSVMTSRISPTKVSIKNFAFVKDSSKNYVVLLHAANS